MSGLEFEILPSESSQPESELKTELTPRAYSLTRLADVKPERPLWLRLGHIPKGKIVLIDGDPATGKSTLALDIAAHVTTGTVWPDGRRVSLPTQQTCTTNSFNATQLNELIGKGGLWASQARREMARRERE